MNTNYRVIPILFVALPLTAYAELITDRNFDYRLDDVAANGVVEIENVSGSIEVEGTSDRYVRVKGKLGRNIEGVEVSRRDDTVSIVVKYDDDENYQGGAELQVWLPQGSAVEVNAVSADIEVSGVRGRQHLNSVSGDVETQAYGEDVSARAVSGDVTVSGTGGKMDSVDLGSVSGDISGSRLHGDIDGRSVSGDVRISDSVIRRGEFQSTSGDVEVSGSLTDESRVSFETVSGDVEFKIDGNKDGTYTLRSFSGDIVNCFGPEMDRSDRHNKRHRFTIGNERVRIDANTMSGDVEICD